MQLLWYSRLLQSFQGVGLSAQYLAPPFDQYKVFSASKKPVLYPEENSRADLCKDVTWLREEDTH